MSLLFPTLISTGRLSAACPPPLSSQPTSVYQTRARLKKEHKRVGRAHSPSINTLTAYIYLTVYEPIVSLAAVERGPLDTETACRFITA